MNVFFDKQKGKFESTEQVKKLKEVWKKHEGCKEAKGRRILTQEGESHTESLEAVKTDENTIKH